MKEYYTDVVQTNDDGTEEKFQIFVVKPNNDVAGAAERYRSTIWMKCVKEGVPTRKEVENLLKERKIWDKDKDEELKKMREELDVLERQLFLGNGDTKRVKLSEGKDIAIKMRKLRIKMQEFVAVKIDMENNSAEAQAENARFDYYVSACTYDGVSMQKVYSSIEDYNSRSTDATAVAAASKLYEVIYNLNSKTTDNIPENRWLKKFGFVDKDYSLVDKNNNNIDLEGRRIDKEGYYLNDEGKRIDKFGNLLNEDNQYDVTVEYEDDTKETSDSDKGSEVKP